MLPGHSSPVSGRADLLTSDKAAQKKLETLALTGSGRTLAAEIRRKDRKLHHNYGPAVATPATDGRRIYVYFGSYGLLCYDFDGNEQWKKPLPLAETFQGNGTSPIVVGDLLLLNREFPPDPSLMAVHSRTGETAWKQARQLASLAGKQRLFHSRRLASRRPSKVSPQPCGCRHTISKTEWNAGPSRDSTRPDDAVR
jgi:hypothetical protein